MKSNTEHTNAKQVFDFLINAGKNFILDTATGYRYKLENDDSIMLSAPIKERDYEDILPKMKHRFLGVTFQGDGKYVTLDLLITR